MGTLVSFIERAADLLSGIDGLHWKQLLATRWMATDGTGLKVIVPKLPAAHNGYIELYRNDEAAVFQYEPDKSGDIVAAKLRSFRGTLTADAEHRFNSVFASGRVLEAGCNALGRRKFRDAEDSQPVLAVTHQPRRDDLGTARIYAGSHHGGCDCRSDGKSRTSARLFTACARLSARA
jgi:transposase